MALEGLGFVKTSAKCGILNATDSVSIDDHTVSSSIWN